MNDVPCEYDAAGWVLGALSPEEAERFIAHLETLRRASSTPPAPTPSLLSRRATSADHDDASVGWWRPSRLWRR